MNPRNNARLVYTTQQPTSTTKPNSPHYEIVMGSKLKLKNTETGKEIAFTGKRPQFDLANFCMVSKIGAKVRNLHSLSAPLQGIALNY